MISGSWKKVEGRGRPRRMYQISPEHLHQAQELTYLWREYITQCNPLPIVSQLKHS